MRCALDVEYLEGFHRHVTYLSPCGLASPIHRPPWLGQLAHGLTGGCLICFHSFAVYLCVKDRQGLEGNGGSQAPIALFAL